MLLKSKKKNGGNSFFRDNKSTIFQKSFNIHNNVWNPFQLETYLQKMRGYPDFLFWVSITIAMIFFSCIFINRAKIPLNDMRRSNAK